jgi:hypothetical protein
VAVILAAETTVNLAAAGPNSTLVAPLRFSPVIVTVIPAAPLLGDTPFVPGASVAQGDVDSFVLVVVLLVGDVGARPETRARPRVAAATGPTGSRRAPSPHCARGALCKLTEIINLPLI